MTSRSIATRFRAYQLGVAGAAYSYFADSTFTMIEARLTEFSEKNLDKELRECGKSTIDILHITGWDQDHCAKTDLEKILSIYRPEKVEYPGYYPHTETAMDCLRIIEKYRNENKKNGNTIQCVTVDPNYIKGLKGAEELTYKNVFYHPRYLLDGDSNNNSTVKLFRKGCFNVASMGDVQSGNISSYLRNCKIFKREIDVLLLAHHGSDCDTNSKKFFKTVKPQIAICSSQYGNQYEHPKPEVRQRLNALDIPIMTTKTGDVIIYSLEPHTGRFRAENYNENSENISSKQDFVAKKVHWLSMNTDTLKNIYNPGYKGFIKGR
jgi:competence protein ComEC